MTGIFVPVGDPTGLAAALARLVADPAERERLSTAARAHYLARFSMTDYMRALDGMYKGIAATPSPAEVLAEKRPT